MKIVKLSTSQFDKFASTHKYRNYFQTSMYGRIMIKDGYHSTFIGIVNNNNKLIGASLLIYKEIFMKYKIAYAPRGILYDYENLEAVETLAENLKKTLGKQGFMLLRMDPCIPLTIRDSDGAIMNMNNKGTTIINNLRKSDFYYKGKNLYFETEKPRWEALITLQRPTEEIFSRLDKRTRNKIRKSINCGVTVERSKTNNINKLFQYISKKEKKPLRFYKEMINQFEDDIDIYYAKIKTETFLVNSRRNYEKEMEYNETLAEKVQDFSLNTKERNSYLNKKMQSDKLITAYKSNLLKATDLLKENPNGLTIAGAMVIKYDNAAYIYTEGLDNMYGNLNANYLIKWQMINDYNKEGLKYINLNAVVGEFEKQNKYQGLNEAKLGFNSTVMEYIGEFDIILNNFGYNLYQKMNKQ